MSNKLKKVVDESRETNNPELDIGDRGIVNMVDVPGLSKWLTSSATSAVLALCGFEFITTIFLKFTNSKDQNGNFNFQLHVCSFNIFPCTKVCSAVLYLET